MNISKIFFPLLISVVFVFNINAQKISGTIYFEDGNFQKFSNIDGIWYRFSNDSNSGLQIHESKMSVFYNNSYQALPLNKIESILVKTYTPRAEYYCDATVEIKTTIGKIITNDFFSLWSCNVYILDDFTGEMKSQMFAFIKNWKLNIRKIVFDHD